ncbi:MAG: endonuclease I family protein [Planctomycetota bacterium]|jgi:endonuclease I
MRSRIADLLAIALLAATGAAGAAGTALAPVDVAAELNEMLATNDNTSFSTTAKRHVFNDVDNRPDDSIECRYSGTTVTLGLKDGHLWPRRADGVQVEHTWPSKAEWSVDADHFERNSVPGADLHHLFTVRQGPNGSRGDKEFGEPTQNVVELRVNANGTLNKTGGGTATGSFRGQDDAGVTVFEPRDEHKGDAARAVFYMSVRYWMAIPEEMEATLRRWHERDPPDAAERARNDRIEAIQANRNPFVDEPDLVELIEDF